LLLFFVVVVIFRNLLFDLAGTSLFIIAVVDADVAHFGFNLTKPKYKNQSKLPKKSLMVGLALPPPRPLPRPLPRPKNKVYLAKSNDQLQNFKK